MSYYCATKNQELNNKGIPGLCSLDINVEKQAKNRGSIMSNAKQIPLTRRNPFKIPEHITLIQCSLIKIR